MNWFWRLKRRVRFPSTASYVQAVGGGLDAEETMIVTDGPAFWRASAQGRLTLIGRDTLSLGYGLALGWLADGQLFVTGVSEDEYQFLWLCALDASGWHRLPEAVEPEHHGVWLPTKRSEVVAMAFGGHRGDVVYLLGQTQGPDRESVPYVSLWRWREGVWSCLWCHEHVRSGVGGLADPDAPSIGRSAVLVVLDEDRLLLFGCEPLQLTTDETVATAQNQGTWLWSGRWRQVSETSPPPSEVSHGVVAGDGSVLAWGARVVWEPETSSVRNWTWCYRGGRWERVATDDPAGIASAFLVQDRSTGVPMLVAERPDGICVWRCDRDTWRLQHCDPSLRHLLAAGPAPAGGVAYATRQGAVWGWDGRGQHRFPLQWLPRELRNVEQLVALPAHRCVVALAKPPDLRSQDATWCWSADRWSVLPGGEAPWKTAATAACDFEGRTIYIYGGSGGDYSPRRHTSTFFEYCAFHRWDGRTWVQLRSVDGTSPGGRFHVGLAVGERGQVWLYGGGQYTDYLLDADAPPSDVEWLNDTWLWDGDRWQRLELRREPRRSVVYPWLWFDPEEGTLYLVGVWPFRYERLLQLVTYRLDPDVGWRRVDTRFLYGPVRYGVIPPAPHYRKVRFWIARRWGLEVYSRRG